MTTSKTQLKPRWQFSLRALSVALFFVCALLAIGARWALRPIVNRGYHENGNVAWEHWQVDRFGYQRVKTVRYYSNGRKSFECGQESKDAKYWLPDGQPTNDLRAWRRACESDGGGSIVLRE